MPLTHVASLVNVSISVLEDFWSVLVTRVILDPRQQISDDSVPFLHISPSPGPQNAMEEGSWTNLNLTSRALGKSELHKHKH